MDVYRLPPNAAVHVLPREWIELCESKDREPLAQSAKKFSSSSTLFGSGVNIWRRLIALTRFS